MKQHQTQNIVPFLFTIASFYLFYKYYEYSIQYFILLFLVVVGLTIWWLAKITLGGSFSMIPKAQKLVTKGIYSKILHPIYFGLSLTLIAWMFLVQFWVLTLIAILIIISCIVRMYFEEKILIKKFGNKYLEYKKKTWF